MIGNLDNCLPQYLIYWAYLERSYENFDEWLEKVKKSNLHSRKPYSEAVYLIEKYRVINQSYGGKLIQAFVNEEVKICLPGEPSSGYLWQYLGNSIPIINEYFDPDDPNTMGSEGHFNFTLLPTEIGHTTLHFSYSRPWEEEVDHFAVSLHIISRNL